MKGNLEKKIDEFLKKLFDIIISLLVLSLASPGLVFLSGAIKFDSAGPVFYRGKRIGRLGVPFKILKFRSMVVNADKIGGPSTSDDDPRLTRVGKFLRQYKLDELPQFINVLKGEMSLVGPRPEVKMYVDMMSKEERSAILSIRPGMTDLASLWDFHEGEVLKGSPDPEKTYLEKIRPTKIKLQMEYVKNRSFLLDLKIIVKTILKVFYG